MVGSPLVVRDNPFFIEKEQIREEAPWEQASERKPWSTPRVIVSEIAKDTGAKHFGPESTSVSLHAVS